MYELSMTVFLAFLASIMFVYASHFFAKSEKFLDQPDKIRKLHRKTTPSSGGLGMGVAIVVLSLLLGMQWESFSEKYQTFLSYGAPGMVIIFFTGIFDDLHGLSSKPKFSLQFLAALFVAYGLVDVYVSTVDIFITDWMKVILAVIAALWVVSGVNAINLSDGIDGNAGSLSIIVMVTLSVIGGMWGASEVSHLLLPFSAIIVGFLLFNRPPASIFMGDTGSMILGFTIASNMLYIGLNADSWHYFIGLPVMLGIPILDTTMSILRRISRGISPFESDSEHIHHMLQRYFQSPGFSVAILASITTLFSLTSILLAQLQNFYFYLSIIAVLVVLLGVVLFSYNKKIGQYLFFENVKILVDKKARDGNGNTMKTERDDLHRVFKN